MLERNSYASSNFIAPVMVSGLAPNMRTQVREK
jgi:hypothetical protein